MRSTVLASMLFLLFAVGASASPPSAAPIVGPVGERLDAGTYTYVRVDTAEGPVWAAGPASEVEVGQVVRVPRGMRMDGYHSKTLDRDFEALYFVNRIEVVGAEGAKADTAGDGDATAPMPEGHPSPHRVIDLRDPSVPRIPRAEGGYTIGELLDEGAELAGETVRVRGKVVRVTENVMERNWIHLRDGTAGADGADDLTVTTTTAVLRGSTVVVKGPVSVDKSFGHSYRYPVMLESPELVVEAEPPTAAPAEAPAEPAPAPAAE